METFKWTVEFTVDETWVADGFEMTPEIAKAMIEKQLGYSYSHETDAKVIKAPAQAAIRKAQGFIAV